MSFSIDNALLYSWFLCFQTIETNFGVTIGYSGGSRALIEISPDYWNNTCGLCGTFDDDQSNDFRTSNGSVVSSYIYHEGYGFVLCFESWDQSSF